MKKIISFILICCMVMSLLPLSVSAAGVVASGCCGEEGDGSNLQWTLESNGTLTIVGNGIMTDAYYAQGIPWDDSPDYRDYIYNLIIDYGVTDIGNYLFYYCTNLSSVSIPDSVNEIGKGSFHTCTSLSSIEIPNSVTTIGERPFQNCTALTSVSIPDSVITLGSYAFINCSGLTTVTLPEILPNWGSGIFYGCASLTTINIPKNITCINESMFRGCKSLSSIIIPSNVNTIEKGAFRGCHAGINVYFEGNAPLLVEDRSVVIGNKLPFDVDAVLYYKQGASGWTDSESYDATAGTWNGYKLECWGKIDEDDSTVEPEHSNYTRFGKYNGSTQNYVTDPTTGFGKYLMETVTIDGFTYNVADTCEQESILLPTNYLSDYYYIAYNLNASNEVSEAKIIPGTVCTLESYDPATKVVDTDQFAPVVDGSTLPSGNYYVSDVTASRFPSDQVGSWIGDQVRVYCVGEQIFKVIHITEGKGEVTAYDKNNAHDIVVIDGITYAVANDGALKARISSPFENNSQYIKDAEFTMYDGTIVELEYVNEKLDPAKFNEYIYRASEALDSANTDTYAYWQEILHGNADVSVMPSQETVDMCEETGFASLAKFWTTTTTIFDSLVDSPYVAYDNLVVKQEDMYTAIILDSLETSYSVGVVNNVNGWTKKTRSISSLVLSEIKLMRGSDTDDAINSWEDVFGTLSDSEKEYITNSVAEKFDSQFGQLDAVGDFLEYLSIGFDMTTTFDAWLENCVSYYNILRLNEEMKYVIQEMYRSCPSSNFAMKAALENCYEVIEAGNDNFKQFMLEQGFVATGKYAASQIAEKAWDAVGKAVEAIFPEVKLIKFLYKAGKLLANEIFNADAESEAYYNLLAVLNYENLARQVMDSLADDFKNNYSEAYAKYYLESVKLNFQILSTDADYAIKFWETLCESPTIDISAILAGTSVEESVGALIDSYNSYKNVLIQDQLLFNNHWIALLKDDCPELYEEYKDRLVETSELIKTMRVACPVNVLVYDENQDIVAYVVNNKPYASDNISVTVEGDVKNLYFYDNKDYTVVCNGYDTGVMDIIINEYDEGKISRNVNYLDVAVNNGSYHDLNDGNNGYVLNSSEGIISPSFDSNADSIAYTISINGGFATTNATFEHELLACEGEIIDISVCVPNGYIFNSWTSTNSAIEFDDANDISTSFVMVDSDVEINAVLMSVSTAHAITFDANGGLTAQDMGVTDDNGKLSSLPTAARNGYIFDGWYTDPVNGTKVTTSTVFTSDTTIYAHWKKDDSSDDRETNIYWLLIQLRNQRFEITATANNGGVITPDRASEVKYGNNITYSITPDEGYAIADVVVDGASVGAVSGYTFESVKESHTITAFFKELAWENPFGDVDEDDWFYEDIEYAYESGLMIGTSDDSFSPTEIVNRAMLVTVLWRLEGSPIVDSSVNFIDIPSGEWYTDAVNWASANGIVNGYGEGIFGATNDLTHEQVMAILNRYAVYKKLSENVSGNADDAYTNSEWAESNVLWADINGLFDGFGSDISNLTKGATRAELAAYLRRFCEKVMK